MAARSMRIAFRVDSSVHIGAGHLMRCLALAEALRPRGADVVFVSRRLPGAADVAITSAGFTILTLPGDTGESPSPDEDAEATRAVLAAQWPATSLGRTADWIAVDHYRLDARWERSVRDLGGAVLAIDDLADRPHDCDVLVDPSRLPDDRWPYDRLVPAGCRQLIGPRYALLRREFREARAPALTARKGRRPHRVLVSMGASDEHDASSKVVRALSRLPAGAIAIDVVAGPSNPHAASLRSLCEQREAFTFHERVTSLASLMAAADMAVGTGGVSSWERCCLGLPAVVLSVAANQEGLARSLEACGAAVWLGGYGDVSESDVADAVARLLDNPRGLASMGAAAASLLDGLGAERVASVLEGEPIESEQRHER
jgi:UDP-2,4-diacetamido-2,4,6-trideoxy-beta-L-altropyranose hydrolase